MWTRTVSRAAGVIARITAGHWIVHVDQVRVDTLYQRVDLPRARDGPGDRLSVKVQSGERNLAADEAGCNSPRN